MSCEYDVEVKHPSSGVKHRTANYEPMLRLSLAFLLRLSSAFLS
jgi:hypothetical protein